MQSARANTQRTLIPKLHIMKPAGPPKRTKDDFSMVTCPYHFVWCPCQVPAVEEEVTKREKESQERDQPF